MCVSGSSVAAAAPVLAVGGRIHPSEAFLDGEAVYIAYANGKRITDESEARRQALADYEEFDDDDARDAGAVGM